MYYNFSHRLNILKYIFGAVFVIFLFRLVDLQIIRGEEFSTQATAQQQKKSILPARRGKILVRKNRYSEDTTPLATNNTLQMLYIDPLVLAYPKYNPKLPLSEQERGNPSLAAQVLAPVLIHAHCEKIDGCIIEMDSNNWTDTERKAINIYTEELQRTFNALERTRVILLTDISKSRSEEILALNFPGISVQGTNLVANPTQISLPENVAEDLSPLIGIPEEKLTKLLTKSYNRYKEITRKIVPEISEKIWELKSDERYRDILRGIQMKDEYWRFYPEKNLAGQILGFVDSSGNGQYGIEGRFDQELRGKAGIISGATNTRGQRIFGKNLGIERAENGADITLSIDRFIQGEVERILEEDLSRFQADAGQVLILEPKTGRILAMANAPGFDPNSFGDVFSRYEISQEQEEQDRDPENEEFNQRIPTIREKNIFYRYFNLWGPEVFRNKIVTDEYEPGSVIKAITMAVGLNTKEIEPHTTYKDTGPVEVDEFKIRNSDNVYAGETNMIDVLSRSLNTGIAFITQKMGSRILYEALKSFGFGEYTDIELDAEAKGQLEHWENWELSELVTRGFGQGFTATPLQVGLAFSALANGGYLMKPILVEKVEKSDGTIEEFSPERIRRVISEETSQTIRSILLSAVNVGTGRAARVYGYTTLGKTGTSQTYKNGKAQTTLGSTIASFAGMGPVDDPQFVIIVKYDHPKSSQWGSETAAVTFRKVAAFLFDYLKIPPDR